MCMRPRRDERGATALMIAIMVPTVFLGIGAIVVNVGGWYVARGMDQNGADAAALAVAKSCADGSCDASAANQYANADSNGQLAGQATIVCGTAPGLSGCDPAIEGGQICPAANDSPYVDVLVAPAGGSMENFTSGTQSVAACAQAALDSVGSCEDCAPVTISSCEWNLATGNGAHFAVPGSVPNYLNTIDSRRHDPSYGTPSAYMNFGSGKKKGIFDPDNPDGLPWPGPPPPSGASVAGSETVLVLTASGGGVGGACSGGKAGGVNSPGNAAWLSNDECNVPITGSTYGGVTGVSGGCLATFQGSRESGKPIYLPVYSSVSGTGGGASYTLAGFAAFVVTGWDLNGGDFTGANGNVGSNLRTDGEADKYCKKYVPLTGAKCLYGYFTEALVPAGPFGGGGSVNLGLTVASLSG